MSQYRCDYCGLKTEDLTRLDGKLELLCSPCYTIARYSLLWRYPYRFPKIQTCAVRNWVYRLVHFLIWLQKPYYTFKFEDEILFEGKV